MSGPPDLEDASPETFRKWIDHLPMRLSPQDVGSEVLAPLFSYVLKDPSRFKAGYSKLRDKLLDLTVRMAKEHTTYYRNLILDRRTPWNYENFQIIPTIDRSELFLNRKDLISKITTFGFISFTSGTTQAWGNQPLMIERSLEEQRYIYNFLRSIQFPMTKSSRLAPLGISDVSLVHGSLIQTPAYGYSFTVDLTKDQEYLRCSWLLQNEFDLPGYESRISFITGPFANLYFLYRYLVENNITLLPGQIRSIVGFATPVSSRRRAEMGEYFGVEVKDNYSITEVFGSARYCHKCDSYHFDPFVVPEVIDLDSNERITIGTGELILTPLFPFTQRFPILRYKTADLVEVNSSICPYGLTSYCFRGRLQNVLKLERGIYFGEMEIAKILDLFKNLNRHLDLSSKITVLKDPGIGEWPRFTLSRTSEGKVLLRVEVKESLEVSRAIQEELESQIRKEILKNLPRDISDWIRAESSRLQIEILPPNTLGDLRYRLI